MTQSRLARSIALTVLGACVVFGPTIGVAASASAHNYLVSSTPAAGSTLTTLPERFEVTTNDDLLNLAGANGGFALQVRDGAGRYYGDGCVSVAGAELSTIATLGAPGKYTVLWQLVSIDGHPVSGEYGFIWAPVAGQPVSTGTATAPVCGAAAPAPSPSASSQAAAPTASPTKESGSGTVGRGIVGATEENSLTDVLWIGGGVVALAGIVVIVLLITGRRSSKKA